MKQRKIISTLVLIFTVSIGCFAQKGLENYNEGFDLIESGRYKDAIKVFSQGIALSDISKNINHYGRAYAYFEIEKLEEAKMDIETALLTEKINAERLNKDLYWLKGWIASAEDDKQLEIACYEKALMFSPENNWLKATLGFALIEDNQNIKGIKILDEVLKTDEPNAFAYNNRALAFIKIGELEKVKSDLDHSKGLDPENPFLYKHYFFYYKEKGELKNACNALEEALEKKMSDYGVENDTQELRRLKAEFCLN